MSSEKYWKFLIEFGKDVMKTVKTMLWKSEKPVKLEVLFQ